MTNKPATREEVAVAVPVDFDPSIGLEDFDVADVTIPRINLDHKEAVFVDSMTGEQYEHLDVVILGLVKQRILWGVDVDEGEGPLCRSNDFNTGIPFVRDFPWKASKFEQPEGTDAALDCAACPLKEWGSHPQGDKPWCTEQYTLILAIPFGESYSPALITFQRSAVKSTKTYISAFARTRQPMFTANTRISLTQNKKGSVLYSIPSFQKLSATDESMWPDFAEQYRRIREWVQTPRSKDEKPAIEASASQSKPSTQSKPAAAAPIDSFDDDEIPF